MHEKVSVCLPVYNAARTILATIKSILNQTFKNFELVVVDNASTDNTLDLVRTIQDKRLKIYQNKKNLGCGRNLEECKKRAQGQILFYICTDDLVDTRALEKVYQVFKKAPDVGLVTRAYYWFEESPSKAIRARKSFEKDFLISINDNYQKIKEVLQLSDQISGTAFRKKYMQVPFGKKPFIETATLVAQMLKECKAVVLKDYLIAVRISSSGTLKPDVYQDSPLLSWYNLVTKTYKGKKYQGLRKYLINNFVANNFIGLVQIKNFGSYQALLREIYYLIKIKWQNIFSFRFWFFTLGTILTPRFLLKKLVVIYKNRINACFLKNVKINLGET